MKISKTLVIVESPSKAIKIQGFLGDNYIVMASKGHITDLAKGGIHGLGIDIKNNFKPKYVLSESKMQVYDELLRCCKLVDNVLLLTDVDREGNSIAWHLKERLKDTGLPIKRVIFNEIKKDKILKAIKTSIDVDINLFHAQEARRILDRLVGFMVSPFLMNFFGPNLSAGRVQSVVTKMVIDRERQIEKFCAEDFWTIQVDFANVDNVSFTSKYFEKISSEVIANKVNNLIKSSNCTYKVILVVSDEEKKYPEPPMITSTLQRLMSKKYGLSADRTMKAAQELYEYGFITYLRTDSVRTSEESLVELRDLIKSLYELPSKPHVYKNKEASQDAHECIRPCDLSINPKNANSISDLDQKKVYKVVYNYFVASQMMPAIYDTLKVTIEVDNGNGNDKVYFKSLGKSLKSKGFLEVFNFNDDSKIDIPYLKVGDVLQLKSVCLEKKQTQPPPRFSEDKLIKELVNKNIGRPATYADLLSKITSRSYVEKNGSVFKATDLGKKITDTLDKYFYFMDYNYTADLEKKLDDIADGKLDHIDMLKGFFPEFKSQLDKAYLDNNGIICDKCQSPMISRTSKNGDKFTGCSSFPKCKNILK